MHRAICLFLIALVTPAHAGDVDIVSARWDNGTIHVTLRHDDTGWDHYADAWRVLTPDGTVLGTRTLYHPHVNEQPFTRSLSNIRVPAGVITLLIEAHDSVHGWAEDRLTVPLPR